MDKEVAGKIKGSKSDTQQKVLSHQSPNTLINGSIYKRVSHT